MTGWWRFYAGYHVMVPLRGSLAQWKGFNDVYSFAPKSATDRWPLTLLMAVMSFFFGPFLAGARVQSTLGYNTFSVLPPAVKRPSAVCFVSRQPLGYYSSWPLWKLTHHMTVWMAAEGVYPACRFKTYAVLGDDIVIADSRVASEYASILDDWFGSHHLSTEIPYLQYRSFLSSSLSGSLCVKVLVTCQLY